MASIKHQNYKNLIQINKFSLSLKLASTFLTSLLFFSVLLTCFSLLPVIFRIVEFVTLINKNYMFLLCNGILVLIVKNSGLITNSDQEFSANTVKKENDVANHRQKAPEVAEVKTEKVAETKKPFQEVQEMEEKPQVVVEDGEDAVLFIEEAVENQEQDNGNVVVVEEEEEDEANEWLITEELNKKCEDFIRKMKEGIRFESQQLIFVQ